MFKGASLQALYHTQRYDPTPKQLMTNMNGICTFKKVWKQKDEHFPDCIKYAFNLIKFQSKSVLLIFFSFHKYYTPTPLLKVQTRSSNSTEIFRLQNLHHQERIQREDTTVLCCCFRNSSQFINTKHSPFSASSFSKFKYFPYLFHRVKKTKQTSLKSKYFFNS